MPDEFRAPARAAPATLAVDSRCELGESILWCERRAALFWTDITGARLWLHRPSDGVTRHWMVPAALGCIGLCDDGRLLLGLAKGLCLADPDRAGSDLPLDQVVDVEAHLSTTRINDGRCDRAGNFVFGTKYEHGGGQTPDDGAPASGSFYQFSFRRGLRRLALPAVRIPNSICFSQDGRTMYFCDSPVPEILCCSYDSESASVGRIRRFTRVDGASIPEAAAPDGSTVDADGCVWNAQWGAARVVCYRPDGAFRSSVALPVKNPSCCTFGGKYLDRLYITSAREGMNAAELAAAPHAGGVFSATVAGARGLPESRVRTS